MISFSIVKILALIWDIARIDITGKYFPSAVTYTYSSTADGRRPVADRTHPIAHRTGRMCGYRVRRQRPPDKTLFVPTDGLGRPLDPIPPRILQLVVDVLDQMSRPAAHPPVVVQVVQHDAVVRQDDERVRRPSPEHLDELVGHLHRPGEGRRHLTFDRRPREDLGVAFPERLDRIHVRFRGFVVAAAVGADALAQLGERPQLQIGGPG